MATLYGYVSNTGAPEYDDILNSDLPQEEKVKQIKMRGQQYEDEINRGAMLDNIRMGLGTAMSAASFHPILNIPYVGTGIGGAMYDAGQAIVEGDKLSDIAKRAGRGFAIGETVGAIPYVGKVAAKTKAGQAVLNSAPIKAIGEGANNLTNRLLENENVLRGYRTLNNALSQDVKWGVNPLKSTREVLLDSASFNKEIEDIARNYFGTTTNRREAGYILNDGTYLDMSGKKFGGYPGRRSLDHREIVDAFLDNSLNKNNLEIGFDEFIDNGAVRYMPETNGFFMAKQPTEEQLTTIKNLLDYERGKSSVELVPKVSDWGLDNNFRRDYKLWSDPKKIIEDIRTYYKGGKPSELKDYY